VVSQFTLSPAEGNQSRYPVINQNWMPVFTGMTMPA
jgi:hypothetical protein